MSFFRRYLSPTLLALLIACLPITMGAIERIDRVNHHPASLTGPDDPDPWMRLSLVHDWLEHGDWFDHSVARSNAPEAGIDTPWTRPLDMVLAGLVALQPGAADLHIKLMRAAAMLPVLWMALLILGLCHALRSMRAPTVSYAMLPFLLLATPVIQSYFGPGNADHHAPLAALWAWVMALNLSPMPGPRDRRVQGGLLALMLWISPEALFLIAVIFAWELGRWLLHGTGLSGLRQLTGATAIGSALALLIERPLHAWLVPLYDSLSLPYVLLMALCALAVQLFACLPERFARKRHYRLLAAKLAGTAVLAIMALCYPAFFKGPMAQVEPFIFSDFLPYIKEAQSIFSISGMYAASLLLLPIGTALVYGRLCLRPHPVLPRAMALQLLWLLLALLLFATIQIRWYYYLTPTVCLMAAAWMGYLFLPATTRPQRRWPEWLLVPLRIALFSLAMAVPVALYAFSHEQFTIKTAHSCASYAHKALRGGQVAEALGQQPLTLLAPSDWGAEVLFFTPYRIVASNYHREGEGLRYLHDAQRFTNADALRTHLAQRQVGAMFFCPDRRTPENSLLRHWWNGSAPLPAWATRVPLRMDDGTSKFTRHPPMLLHIR